ncbi:hypothetical protein C9189_26175 [Escherichia coli]|nr:hypothetical protein [Escherichia coli]TJE69192.1 hypothetical protein C9209_23860 [Escherichia coli]TJE70468.1 hypothetical protein C9212_25210 [Escherichia coli]TJE72988.1 hypothetical protein C9208_23135 [Escherichia coli]TJE83831.1 hypothetical protein C9211_26105 [Escherichia coli]
MCYISFLHGEYPHASADSFTRSLLRWLFFYYAAAFTSGTRLFISTPYVVLRVTNIITINRHRISPVYRNRVKKPESNRRMNICQWLVVKKRPRHAQPEIKG